MTYGVSQLCNDELQLKNPAREQIRGELPVARRTLFRSGNRQRNLHDRYNLYLVAIAEALANEASRTTRRDTGMLARVVVAVSTSFMEVVCNAP